ncbi:hypothetical protein H4S07_005953, partial [Coemansia furcata]
RQRSPSSGAAETPLDGEKFYAARKHETDAVQPSLEHSTSQGTINGNKEAKALPAYDTPQASAGTAPATAVTSPEIATSQPQAPTVSFPVPFASI